MMMSMMRKLLVGYSFTLEYKCYVCLESALDVYPGGNRAGQQSSVELVEVNTPGPQSVVRSRQNPVSLTHANGFSQPRIPHQKTLRWSSKKKKKKKKKTQSLSTISSRKPAAQGAQ
jgi:hypothetical protein